MEPAQIEQAGLEDNVHLFLILASKRTWPLTSLKKEFHRDQDCKAGSLLEAQYMWESSQRSSLFRAEVKVTHSKKSAVSSQVDPSFILFLAL